MAKISIIDDDDTMISLMETLLTIEGYTVLLINPRSSEGIVDQLYQHHSELIILDVIMREKNGLDILHQLRQDPRFERVKVIMASGMDMRDKCLREGANGFLLKPYMPEELIRVIHDQLII